MRFVVRIDADSSRRQLSSFIGLRLSPVLPGAGRLHERHVVVFPGVEEDLLPGVGHSVGHEPGDPHDLRGEGDRVNA